MAVGAKTALITGANSGIGKDVARQLPLCGDFAKVYLACRNRAKAEAAKRELETATGTSMFEVVIMDVSDLESVRAAVASLAEPLTAVVMNAGGNGGPTPRALTADGVTQMFASNVLGHVVLLESLLAAGTLTEVAVYVGSEAARGVPKLRIPRPAFATSSTDELASAIDGSYFDGRKYRGSLDYGQSKYIAALWMAALARQHPDLRFITMSPGNTAGTEGLQHHLVRVVLTGSGCAAVADRGDRADQTLLSRHAQPRRAPGRVSPSEDTVRSTCPVRGDKRLLIINTRCVCKILAASRQQLSRCSEN